MLEGGLEEVRQGHLWAAGLPAVSSGPDQMKKQRLAMPCKVWEPQTKGGLMGLLGPRHMVG